MLELESSSAAETEAIAAALARRLGPGDVVAVSGELGAGKTTFVRGACRELGVTGPVTSPSFTIGHRHRGRVDVSHLDLYRFEGMPPSEWGDLETYFEGAVAFVEWPDAARGWMPDPCVEVALHHRREDDRRLVALAFRDPTLESEVSRDARARLRHRD